MLVKVVVVAVVALVVYVFMLPWLLSLKRLAHHLSVSFHQLITPGFVFAQLLVYLRPSVK